MENDKAQLDLFRKLRREYTTLLLGFKLVNPDSGPNGRMFHKQNELLAIVRGRLSDGFSEPGSFSVEEAELLDEAIESLGACIDLQKSMIKYR